MFKPTMCTWLEKIKLHFSKKYISVEELNEKIINCSQCGKYNNCNINESLKNIYWKKVDRRYK